MSNAKNSWKKRREKGLFKYCLTLGIFLGICKVIFSFMFNPSPVETFIPVFLQTFVFGVIGSLIIWHFNEAQYQQTHSHDAGKIILLSIGAAVLYGVIHDQFSTRISMEYFTIAHPPMIDSSDPTIQALFWGTAGTWWVGLILGLPLAYVSSFGKEAPVSWKKLIEPLFILLLIMGSCSFLANQLTTLYQQTHPALYPYAGIASHLLKDFSVVANMHYASYASGLIGGLILILWTHRQRKKRQKS